MAKQLPLCSLKPGTAFRLPQPHSRDGWKVEDVGGDVKVQTAEGKREIWSSATMVFLIADAPAMPDQSHGRHSAAAVNAAAAEIAAQDTPPAPRKLR